MTGPLTGTRSVRAGSIWRGEGYCSLMTCGSLAAPKPSHADT